VVTATQSPFAARDSMARKLDSIARLRVRNLAVLGKGRALLDKADFPGAAAAVAVVPADFSYSTFHSVATDRQRNGVFVFNNQPPNGTGRFSVSDREGMNGLDFRSAGDPRVVAPQNGKGFDNTSPLYVLQKYTSATSPVHVADGVEARLIEAEAQLRAGDGPGMVTSLNALRIDAVNNGGFNLAALADPGPSPNDSVRVDLLFRERAFWLFATGHRLGDLRRLARAPYGRAVKSLYPTGVYTHTNTVYGDNTELPVPFSERNNPNFTGCDYNTP